MPGVAIIVHQQQIKSCVLDLFLPFSTKLVAVRHHPQSSLSTGLRNRLGRIFGAARGETSLHQCHAVVAEPLFERDSDFSVKEDNLAFGGLPGLGEGQTPHHMARPHSRTGIGPDQAGFHLESVRAKLEADW